MDNNKAGNSGDVPPAAPSTATAEVGATLPPPEPNQQEESTVAAAGTGVLSGVNEASSKYVAGSPMATSRGIKTPANTPAASRNSVASGASGAESGKALASTLAAKLEKIALEEAEKKHGEENAQKDQGQASNFTFSVPQETDGRSEMGGEGMDVAEKDILDGLQKVQNETYDLDVLYAGERMKLEKKYFDLRKQQFDQRKEYVKKMGDPFWLRCMLNKTIVANQISLRDESALKYLEDITATTNEDLSGFKIEFHFSNNPYFENKVLAREYTCMLLIDLGQEPELLASTGTLFNGEKGWTSLWSQRRSAGGSKERGK